MTQVVLPKLNQTGDNEWADVEDNDKALRDVINGQLDNGNLSGAAGVTGANIANDTIESRHLAVKTLAGLIDGSGTIAQGTGGFTARKTATGEYTVTFDTALPSVPVVVCGRHVAAKWGFATANSEGTTGFNVEVRNAAGTPVDEYWSFHAVG